MAEWSGLPGQKDLDHGEFRHHFQNEQGAGQSGKSLAWFKFVILLTSPKTHFGFVNTSGPLFPIQTSRQIRMYGLKSTIDSIAISNRRERVMFEAWFLQVNFNCQKDCLTSCHAMFSLLEFNKQQPGKGSGRLIRIGSVSVEYPAWHKQSGIMPVAI